VPDDLPGIDRIFRERGRTTLETDSLQSSLSDLLAWAALNDVELEDLEASSPSLEAVFLSIADGRDPAHSAIDGAQDVLTREEGSSR
jgi:ABC-2 type transport system ATP-binding protein